MENIFSAPKPTVSTDPISDRSFFHNERYLSLRSPSPLIVLNRSPTPNRIQTFQPVQPETRAFVQSSDVSMIGLTGMAQEEEKSYDLLAHSVHNNRKHKNTDSVKFSAQERRQIAQRFRTELNSLQRKHSEQKEQLNTTNLKDTPKYKEPKLLTNWYFMFPNLKKNTSSNYETKHVGSHYYDMFLIGKPLDNQNREWHSSAIVQRIGPNRLISRKGTIYEIKIGNCNFEKMCFKNPELSALFLLKFKKSIPENWQQLIDREYARILDKDYDAAFGSDWEDEISRKEYKNYNRNNSELEDVLNSHCYDNYTLFSTNLSSHTVDEDNYNQHGEGISSPLLITDGHNIIDHNINKESDDEIILDRREYMTTVNIQTNKTKQEKHSGETLINTETDDILVLDQTHPHIESISTLSAAPNKNANRRHKSKQEISQSEETESSSDSEIEHQGNTREKAPSHLESGKVYEDLDNRDDLAAKSDEQLLMERESGEYKESGEEYEDPNDSDFKATRSSRKHKSTKKRKRARLQ